MKKADCRGALKARIDSSMVLFCDCLASNVCRQYSHLFEEFDNSLNYSRSEFPTFIMCIIICLRVRKLSWETK